MTALTDKYGKLIQVGSVVVVMEGRRIRRLRLATVTQIKVTSVEGTSSTSAGDVSFARRSVVITVSPMLTPEEKAGPQYRWLTRTRRAQADRLLVVG